MPGFWRKLSAQSKHSNAAQVGEFWKESDYTILQTLSVQCTWKRAGGVWGRELRELAPNSPFSAQVGKVVAIAAEGWKNANTAINHQTDGS